MLEHDLISLFIIPLKRAKVEYMVTGSVAAMLYGEPRMTHDIDLIVELNLEQIAGLLDSFPEQEYYRPPKEVIGIELARPQRGHFNLIHQKTGYKADVYLQGSDALQKWGMKNRKNIVVGECEIRIAPAEYIILRKIEYYRESGYQKHIHDVEGMLRISGKEISLTIIEEWVKKLSLEKEWAVIIKKIVA